MFLLEAQRTKFVHSGEGGPLAWPAHSRSPGALRRCLNDSLGPLLAQSRLAEPQQQQANLLVGLSAPWWSVQVIVSGR